MIKRVIKYEDYDGNMREEPFYFNLDKAELAQMEMETEGGLKATVERMQETTSAKQVSEMFKDLIERSYGEKSVDGKFFTKSPEIFAKFKSTVAYSELYMELATDVEKARQFVNGLLPGDIQKKIAEMEVEEKRKAAAAALPPIDRPTT